MQIYVVHILYDLIIESHPPQGIFVDASSLVGGVGVVSTPGLGFGFDKLISSLGIDRRRFISGERKADLMMDPWSPVDPTSAERLVALQGEIHEVFKRVVRKARGEALEKAGTKEDAWATGEVFSGECVSSYLVVLYFIRCQQQA